MGFEAALMIGALAGAGASIYSASKKPPAPKTPGAPPAPVDGALDTGKKRKTYRPAAQVFKDEDLRLGGAGRLGV